MVKEEVIKDEDLKSAIEQSPWEREMAICKAYEEADSEEEREMIREIMQIIRPIQSTAAE